MKKNIWLLLISVNMASAHTLPENNLSVIQNEIVQYHDSRDYNKDMQKVIDQAKKYVLSRVKENNQKKVPDNLAIVFDIDETVLSNMKFMKKHHFGGSYHDFKVNELCSQATAIKETKQLYNTALQHHVSTFFITGREPFEKAATVRNLKKEGFKSWSGIFFKPKNKKTPLFKTLTRKKIEEKGFVIIASLGDQYSDLVGGHTEKTFKLPNFAYFIP